MKIKASIKTLKFKRKYLPLKQSCNLGTSPLSGVFLTSGTFSEEPASASEVTDGTAETECKFSILIILSNSVLIIDNYYTQHALCSLDEIENTFNGTFIG